MNEQGEVVVGRTGRINEIYEWVEWAIGIMICVVLILSFVVRTVGVYGISMLPTLEEGDGLIVTRLAGAPEYGDIVAIAQPNYNNIPIIKRVIATAGQTVNINFETGDVTVDGVLLDEPYIRQKIQPESRYDVVFPQTIPEGCIFVMGDNRNQSWDSRASDIGMIDNRYVLGKVLLRIFPLPRFGVV